MVGYKFCEKLANKGLTNKYDVVVYGEEPWVAYDRVHLSEYFTGSTVEDLQMAPRAWYEENSITLHTTSAIVNVNKEFQLSRINQF